MPRQCQCRYACMRECVHAALHASIRSHMHGMIHARQCMQYSLGPPNLCRNGDCGELVEMCCRFQHYCCGCASSNLGLRAGKPALRITLALRRRRRVVGRVLLCHKARPPPCVVTYILDHLMNDLGKVSPSTRWACILIRSGVQLA